MKDKLFFFLILMFSCSCFSEEEGIEGISREAQALWWAKDYDQARALYEKLLSLPLPVWQKMRLLYNQGTIQLSQGHLNEAIHLFQTIEPYQLSLPRFTRDLYLNQGVSYLQFVKNMEQNSPFYQQQEVYLLYSLMLLEKANRVGCELQKEEGEEACNRQHLIEGWIAKSLMHLDVVHEQKIKHWMDNASIETLSTYLSILLQQLIAEVKQFQDSSWIAYFQHQAESLDFFWKSLKSKKLAKEQITLFDKAFAEYSNSLSAFKKKEISSALDALERSFEQLTPLDFKEDVDLRLAHLNYEILLLQPSITVEDVQGVQWEVKQLKIDKAEEINQNLQQAIVALEKKDPIQTRFYLIAGFGMLDSLLLSKDPSSTASLKSALDQANRTFTLNLLARLMPEQKMLIEQQEAVLLRAASFIPAVLKEQNINYHDANHQKTSCQQSPWDQVIPLFDHGLQAAKKGAVAAQQEQTLQDWQQAYNLLLSPPQLNQSSGASAPKNYAETFRLIQEMYLEDQPKQPQETGEMHTW